MAVTQYALTLPTVIYLDHNATTPVDDKVLDAMLPYFTQKFGNAASTAHRFGWVAADAVALARERVAALLNTEPSEITFTSGATEAINLALKGVWEVYAGTGNHIVTVATEHKAVLDVCQSLERRGAQVTYLPVDGDGLTDITTLEEAITPQTILVCVMMANNETGVLQPIAEIGKLCKERGVLFMSDITQAAGKLPVDVQALGIDIAPRYIPADVFDRRAVEKNQVVFHDVAYIEVKPYIKPAGKNTPGSVAIELTDFSVFYNQDIVDNVVESLRKGADKVLVENGNIIKISKDKDGIVKREVLTKKWTDWIDYWAVDFDFESKKEIIRINKKEGDQEKLDGSSDPKQEKFLDFEEVWTGDYIFENEWQSFRTKKDRSIELKSIAHECQTGRRKIAVKVVDIFGNDTMKIIEVRGGKK